MLMEEEQPKVSWAKQPYLRLPWFRVKYGSRVLPPLEQHSNTSLADEQVMQRRDDRISMRSTA